MKIITFLICYALSLLSSKAQYSYSELINIAELNFIDRDYKSAFEKYKEAVKIGSNIFGKDLYNAALTAERLKDYKQCSVFLDSLCKKGFEIRTLEKKTFSGFLNTKFYKNLVGKYIDRSSLNLTQKQNRKLLNQILEDDQYFRLKNPRNYMQHEFASVIKILDSINAYKLVDFIKLNGFPSEFNCGIDSAQNAPFENFPTRVLIMHQVVGSQSRVINFAPYILEALKKTEVLPHIGVGLYRNANLSDSLFGIGSFFELEQVDGTVKYAYYPKFLNGKEEKYNSNRKIYNLEPLDDYRKKIIYWLKNKELIFDFIMGEDIERLDKSIAKYMKDVKYIE